MTSRFLGLVVVPGEFINKIEVEEFASQMRGKTTPGGGERVGNSFWKTFRLWWFSIRLWLRPLVLIIRDSSSTPADVLRKPRSRKQRMREMEPKESVYWYFSDPWWHGTRTPAGHSWRRVYPGKSSICIVQNVSHWYGAKEKYKLKS